MASEAVTNSIDNDVFEKVQTSSEIQTTAKVETPAHAAFLKLTHPPSAVPGYCGLPTNDARTQVCVEYVTLGILQNPSTVTFGGGSAAVAAVSTTSGFDYAFLQTSGARYNAIGFVTTASADNYLTQDCANSFFVDSVNWQTWGQNVNKYRLEYQSGTTSLNTGMINPQGIVGGCQFNPSILFAGTLLAMAYNQPETFYRFVECNHKRGFYDVLDDFPAKYTKDNYAIIAETEHKKRWDQFPSYVRQEIATRLKLKSNEHLTLDPNTTVQIVNWNDFGADTTTVPFADQCPTLSQIMNNSTRSWSGKATEGAFSINRLNTVAPKWYSSTVTAAVSPTFGLYECYYSSIDATFALHIVPFFEQMAIGHVPGGGDVMFDTQWTDDMTWSWTYYSGIQPNYGLAPTSSNRILAYKFYKGLSLQASPRSAYAGMSKIGPKPDLAVMQAIMEAFYELKDCMPAKYNFWGTLGSLAASGLKELGSSLVKELMGGSKTKSEAPKKSKPARKEKAEVRDTDRQVHSLNRKMDNMMRDERSGRYPVQRRRQNNNGNRKPSKSQPPRRRSNSRNRNRSASRGRREPSRERGPIPK